MTSGFSLRRPSGHDDADQAIDELVDRGLVGALGHLLAQAHDDILAVRGRWGSCVPSQTSFAPSEGDLRPEAEPRLTVDLGAPPGDRLEPAGDRSAPLDGDGPRRRGVRATVAAPTHRAPADRRARAAAARVAPVVATSSTTSTQSPVTGADPKTGPRRRSRADRPVWEGPARRVRQGRTGTPSPRPTARARCSAWSKPRPPASDGGGRRPGHDVDRAHRPAPAARSTRTAARTGRAERALRYLSRASASRTAPS